MSTLLLAGNWRAIVSSEVAACHKEWSATTRLTSGSGVAWADQGESAGVAVNLGIPLHRPDLAAAEETGQRHLAERAAQGVAVVIGAPVEAGAPSDAGEKQRTRWCRVVFRAISRQGALEVLRRGERVAHVELHDAVRFELGADPQRAALRIHAEHIADQEIAGLHLRTLPRHREPDEERMTDELAIARRQFLEQCRKDIARRHAVELAQQVPVTGGDEHRIADRSTTLGHDRIDLHVAREREEDRAAAKSTLPQVEEIASRLSAAAREPADLERVRERTIETRQNIFGGEGEGVGDHEKLRTFAGLEVQGGFPLGAIGELPRQVSAFHVTG